MKQPTPVSSSYEVKRIGILLGDVGQINVAAFKFLVLRMNTLQRVFEYEFLPVDLAADPFLQQLSRSARVDREEVRARAPEFLARYREYLFNQIMGDDLTELPTTRFILITMARFSQRYYSLREKELTILALGDWKRSMAPPSLFEVLLTLILRQSVAFVSPSLRGSGHLGTKGCLLDFTPTLAETRFKALGGFICNTCLASLQYEGQGAIADELVPILDKRWLGDAKDPRSPSAISAQLGYHLSLTRGLKATPWERVLSLAQQESVRLLAALAGGVLLAILLLLLALR